MNSTSDGLSQPPGDTRKEDGALFLQGVASAIDVMQTFRQANTSLSLGEIAKLAGINKSRAQRIVYTLRQKGLIRESETGHGFVPDLKILDLTLDFLRLNTIIERATPILMGLRRNVRERVDLSLFDDTRIVYAIRMQSKREAVFATLVGHSVPTYCSSGGRAILSTLPVDIATDIVNRSQREPFTNKTITDVEVIMEMVHKARDDGYAVAQEEILIGEIALGVAIKGVNGRAIGAIHIAGSLAEWTPDEFRARFAPFAVEAANAINISNCYVTHPTEVDPVRRGNKP